MSEPTPIHITLKPDGVIYPTRRAAIFAANAVGTYLRALESDDLSPPQLTGDNLKYQFADLGLDKNELREAYQNWILNKGFQDLARGVRETLEEADFLSKCLACGEPTGLTRRSSAKLTRSANALPS